MSTEPKTEIDPEALKTAATELEKLIDQPTRDLMAKLTDMAPEAGEFDAAKWIEDRVQDRRGALRQHFTDLDEAFNSLAVKLRGVVDIISDKDDEGSVVYAAMNEWVDGVNAVERPGAKGNQLGTDGTYDSGDTAPGNGRAPIDYIKEPNGDVRIVPDGVTFQDEKWKNELDDVFSDAKDDAGAPGEEIDYDGGFYTDEPIVITPNSPEDGPK